MAKITIAQLPTSDSYINELTATELDATKGGLLNFHNSPVLSGNDVDVPVTVKDTTVGLVAVDNALKNLLNGL